MSLMEIQQRIRGSVDKDTSKEWMVVPSHRAYIDLLADWTVIVLAFLSVSIYRSPLTFLLAAVVIGTRQYALFILGHDAIHGSLHPDPKVNDSLARWFIHGPLCMGFDDGKLNHLEHHKLLGTTADPDRYIHSISNKFSVAAFLMFCSGMQTFVKTVIKVSPLRGLVLSTAAVSLQTDESHQLTGETATHKHSATVILLKYFKQRIPVFVSQAVILSCMLLLQLPLWLYPLLWIAPIYFLVFLTDEIRAFSEHAVLTNDEEAVDDQRLITFRPSLIEAIIFSPHNMNYHAEHHLWPRVPYYKLPAVYKAVKNEPELTVRRSYLQFLGQVVAFLKREKQQCPLS